MNNHLLLNEDKQLLRVNWTNLMYNLMNRIPFETPSHTNCELSTFEKIVCKNTLRSSSLGDIYK